MNIWQVNNNNGQYEICSGSTSFICQIGSGGVIEATKKSEGDRCTPSGFWQLKSIYYRADKINHKALISKSFLSLKKITKNCSWCDDYKSKNYVHLSTLELKDGESRRIYLKDIKYPPVITYKVFKNEDASTGKLYLVTNELELSGDCIYKIYQRRWSIETYHRSLKQNTSLGKSPTSVKKTQSRGSRVKGLFLSLVKY